MYSGQQWTVQQEEEKTKEKVKTDQQRGTGRTASGMWSCDSHACDKSCDLLQGGGGAEDVDAVIREVNELLGETSVREAAANTSSFTAVHRSLLSVDKR